MLMVRPCTTMEKMTTRKSGSRFARRYRALICPQISLQVTPSKTTRLRTLFRLNLAPKLLALARFLLSPVCGLFLPPIFLGTAAQVLPGTKDCDAGGGASRP
jgi:hypothetical protein